MLHNNTHQGKSFWVLPYIIPVFFVPVIGYGGNASQGTPGRDPGHGRAGQKDIIVLLFTHNILLFSRICCTYNNFLQYTACQQWRVERAGCIDTGPGMLGDELDRCAVVERC